MVRLQRPAQSRGCLCSVCIDGFRQNRGPFTHFDWNQPVHWCQFLIFWSQKIATLIILTEKEATVCFNIFIESTKSTIKKKYKSHLNKTRHVIQPNTSGRKHQTWWYVQNIQNIYRVPVLPRWLLTRLNRFDWNPVAVRLPAFIAVGSSSDFGARNGHGGFGHSVLEPERRHVRTGRDFTARHQNLGTYIDAESNHFAFGGHLWTGCLVRLRLALFWKKEEKRGQLGRAGTPPTWVSLLDSCITSSPIWFWRLASTNCSSHAPKKKLKKMKITVYSGRMMVT